MSATREAWVPETSEQLEAFQRKLTRHLVRRRPNFPKAILNNEIVPDAWSVGYAEYLEMLMDPEIEEIKDPEALLLTICVNEGEHLIRSSVRRDARFQVKAASGNDPDDEVLSGQTIEDIAAKDQAILEKYSTVAAAVKKDQSNVMFSAMAQLPEGQLDAFRRVILQNQPQVEAAREIGIGIRPFEKRLKKAVSQVAWAITKTCDQSLCEEFNEITSTMPDPANPNREQQTVILKHVQNCSACKAAIFESPFGEGGLGAILATGAFSAHTGASVWERITSLPIIDVPADIARNAWEKVWPGSHGAEAAVGGGTAAGGAGGTALAIGGGKALVTLCAGVATTACVAGVATGVIPIAQSNADRNTGDKKQDVTRTAEVDGPAFVDSRATYEAGRAQIESTIDRRQARRKARQEAKAAAAKAASSQSTNSSTGSSSTGSDQASYSSPVTTNPTTQAETNESAAASSMGIPTSGSTSSSSGSSSGSSTAQTQTNESSANDSFGIGQ